MELHQKELEINQRLGDEAGLYRSYWNMGSLLNEMEEKEQALLSLEKSISYGRRLKSPDLEKDIEALNRLKAELGGPAGNELN